MHCVPPPLTFSPQTTFSSPYSAGSETPLLKVKNSFTTSSLQQFLSQFNPTDEDLVVLDFYGTLQEELGNPDSVELLRGLLSRGVHVIICTSESDPSPILRILESHEIALSSQIGKTEIPHGILSAISKGLEIRKLLERSGLTFKRTFLIDDTILNLSLADKILRSSPTEFFSVLYRTSSPQASSPSTVALSPGSGASPSMLPTPAAVPPRTNPPASSSMTPSSNLPPVTGQGQAQARPEQTKMEEPPSCLRSLFCCMWCKA